MRIIFLTGTLPEARTTGLTLESLRQEFLYWLVGLLRNQKKLLAIFY